MSLKEFVFGLTDAVQFSTEFDIVLSHSSENQLETCGCGSFNECFTDSKLFVIESKVGTFAETWSREAISDANSSSFTVPDFGNCYHISFAGVTIPSSNLRHGAVARGFE